MAVLKSPRNWKLQGDKNALSRGNFPLPRDFIAILLPTLLTRTTVNLLQRPL